MNEPKAPYTSFGQTRDVPIKIYDRKGGPIEGETEWDYTMWVERGEDWYGLSSFGENDRIQIISRQDWFHSPRID